MLLNEIIKSNAYTTSFEVCNGCENHCQVKLFHFQNGKTFASGNNCEKIYSSFHESKQKGINMFAEKYKLRGLFSGMIISELQEAIDLGVPTNKEEIDREMEKFTIRLKYCIETYGLEQTAKRMKDMDDVQSALTKFNYGNLHYYE